MSLDNPPNMIQSASSSTGYVSSREMLITYIKRLSKPDIRRLLGPLKDGLLTENTLLYMNTANFSVDHVVVPITVREFLDELGPEWKKWVHTFDVEDEDYQLPPHMHNTNRLDVDINDFKIIEYIKSMSKIQKRSLLNLVREGYLTDECFLSLSHESGPERIQVPMRRVVEALGEAEVEIIRNNNKQRIIIKILYAKHYSSASFERSHRADLDVRALSACRLTMPIWYTITFLMMTIGTTASQIWSQATNYTSMQMTLNLTVPTFILIVSSLANGLLLYLTIYMIGFLCCCENNMSSTGLLTRDLIYGPIYAHFCELNRIEMRIYMTKILQFGLLVYTMVLAIYAHENNLNIYPALVCVLTNGFGLMLFARIAVFFRTCRHTRNGTAIASR